eukprot:48501_1
MSTKRRTKSKASRKKQPVPSPNKPKKTLTPSKQSQTPSKSKSQTKPNIKSPASAYPTKTSYTPSLSIRYLLLAGVIRIASALFNPISDCDETFNYWEPTAFLLTNYGFQTWEYSPLYALRSYAYLLPQYGIGHVLLSSFSLSTQPFIIFYALRIILSIICVLCEFYFASSLTPWFGPQTSFFTFIFLALSSGMFNCCAAYLPQQFVLCMLLLSFGCFFRQYRVCAIWFMGCAAIIGWPFIALLAVPLAIDCIMFYGMIGFIAYVVVFGSILCGASIAIDLYFYGKYVLPPLNIFLYNLSLTSSSDNASLSGQNLYGVDDWTYYVKNLILNWNIVYVLAIVAPLASNWIVLFLCKRRGRSNRKGGKRRSWRDTFKNFVHKFGHDSVVCHLFHCIAPLWIWMLFFMYMPHKEERFMFVIYPFIAVNAAITLTQFRMMKMDKIDVNIVKYMKLGVIAVFGVLCASRSVGQVMYYKGSLDIWYETGEYVRNDGSEGKANICVGKEWYRIPSTLFVSDVAEIKWIKSGFDGQLPAEFETTDTVSQPSNDKNQMEASRFVEDINANCDYIVDLWESNSVIEGYDVSKYEVVKSVKFLDRDATQSTVFRSLYIPFISDRKVVYANYKLLKRKDVTQE